MCCCKCKFQSQASLYTFLAPPPTPSNLLLPPIYHFTTSSHSHPIPSLPRTPPQVSSSPLIASPSSHPPYLPPLPPPFSPLPQINGDTNPKLQSLHLENFPVLTARFTPDGREVIASGIRRGFFVYDMYSGKVDKIHGIKGAV